MRDCSPLLGKYKNIFIFNLQMVPAAFLYKIHRHKTQNMKQLFESVKYIAFDADDTLWVNEPYFRVAEKEYCTLLERFATREEIISTLYEIEMKNLAPYGYGAKAFTLSLMETAILFSNKSAVTPLTPSEMLRIIEIGTSLIRIPIEILPGVEELLKELSGSGKYTLVVATKGDLLDQERKLRRSGLWNCFHHIEVMSDKNEEAYTRLLERLGCSKEEFLMIGNSMKSDIIPVLNIGGNAIYIPFYSTWEHEKVEGEITHPNLYETDSCSKLLEMIK
jgi:putative hydrolase of the HAD superfamily